VDTVVIRSQIMNREIKCVVIRPASYDIKKKRFPVLYLLHGYDGGYDNWIKRAPELTSYADTYQVLIVCPDGGKSSWYFDSPVDPAMRYETYISKEVVKYIDTHFKTIADKAHRAITGLSMGGHGALFLALRHPKVFGEAGSMSGGFDLNDNRRRFDVSERVGDTIHHASNWHDLSVYYLIEKYASTPVKIIFDCGTSDIFIDANRKTHQKMLQLKIPHEYSERPGTHDWNYWRRSLPLHLNFFSQFFQKSV
jgi:S-formylglutathione hydrolase FrmB